MLSIVSGIIICSVLWQSSRVCVQSYSVPQRQNNNVSVLRFFSWHGYIDNSSSSQTMPLKVLGFHWWGCLHNHPVLSHRQNTKKESLLRFLLTHRLPEHHFIFPPLPQSLATVRFVAVQVRYATNAGGQGMLNKQRGKARKKFICLSATS